jgi:hypothetical protein
MMTRKIDMGGFKNEEVEVVFGTDIYKIMLDPPIEATRMLIELEGLKMDSEDNLDKFKEFVSVIISKNNPQVDKQTFKDSLSLNSCINFINGYTSLLPGRDLKKDGIPSEQTSP